MADVDATADTEVAATADTEKADATADTEEADATADLDPNAPGDLELDLPTGTAPDPSAGAEPDAKVSVIVIAHNDARYVRDAVRSALAQGPQVAELIAVDDASTDRTGAVLEELARDEPRLRVLHRTVNSGGCGTPRNDGLRVATAPYVMFLDSDDVLPPGAVRSLLGGARRHRAPVVAGACVRRELPSGRETRWQRALFLREAAYDCPADRPRLVRDTLCVNKLYARSFLLEHRIAFPEGASHYEDFVFSARVLTAAPRLAVITDPVYIWHVRRSAAAPSISLTRDGDGGIANWRDRLAAHRTVVSIFEEAGAGRLAQAARVKFLDYDLRMYIRELPDRSPEYQREWWRLARGHLAAFNEAELGSARAPARWLARVILSAPEVRGPDLVRMAQLAARPARLLPPYAWAAGRPVWSADLPGVELDGIDSKPLYRLPLAADAELLTGGTRPGVRLRVRELYGQLAAAGVLSVDLMVLHRDDGRPAQIRSAQPRAEGDWWTAEVRLDLEALAAPDRPSTAAPTAARGSLGDDRPGGPVGVRLWDLRVRVRCTDGRCLRAAVRPTGTGARAGLHRRAVPSLRHGLLFVQPYATSDGALALRTASGPLGLLAIAAGRVWRLLSGRCSVLGA